ncbi:hypothetical protein EV379_0149 [Microterricola gilva]|uniref:Very-short-patch-repair endonuclease n=1 Tax=Microterricola gilva TaxID=393267 RepID=A0A4Q8AHI5_9MICO|nr:hypothetical protein [Microterricola gilva]RZU63860.1 hypothetical protein EV379_0149 [Microterricola gilva]
MPQREPLPSALSGHPFTVSTARAAGVARGRLRAADLARPFYGVRTPVSAEDSALQRCRAFMPRMQPGQFFSHLSAARLWGAPLPDRFGAAEALHVSSFAPQRPPRTRGVVGHELRPGSATLTMRYGVPVTDPATTWVQLSTLLPPHELVAVGDHLVLDPVVLDPLDPRPFTSVAALTEQLAGHIGRGKRAATGALPRVRAGAESRPETLLRLLLVDAGLPEPRVNVTLHTADGRFLARVDLVYPAWHVGVEYDGDHHRENARQYEADMYRRERVALARWDVVYVRSRGLFVTPADTVERVRAALNRAGWRG